VVSEALLFPASLIVEPRTPKSTFTREFPQEVHPVP